MSPPQCVACHLLSVAMSPPQCVACHLLSVAISPPQCVACHLLSVSRVTSSVCRVSPPQCGHVTSSVCRVSPPQCGHVTSLCLTVSHCLSLCLTVSHSVSLYISPSHCLSPCVVGAAARPAPGATAWGAAGRAREDDAEAAVRAEVRAVLRVWRPRIRYVTVSLSRTYIHHTHTSHYITSSRSTSRAACVGAAHQVRYRLALTHIHTSHTHITLHHIEQKYEPCCVCGDRASGTFTPHSLARTSHHSTLHFIKLSFIIHHNVIFHQIVFYNSSQCYISSNCLL